MTFDYIHWQACHRNPPIYEDYLKLAAATWTNKINCVVDHTDINMSRSGGCLYANIIGFILALVLNRYDAIQGWDRECTDCKKKFLEN